MSVRFPDFNASASGSQNLTLLIPQTMNRKPANTGCILGAFVRAVTGGRETNMGQVVLAYAGGGNGGADVRLMWTSQAQTSMSLNYKNGGGTQFSQTISGVPVGVDLFVAFVVNQSRSHFVVCPVGGSMLSATAETATMYNLSRTTTPFIDGIGGGHSSPTHYGPLEEVFFVHGLFPEVGSSPSASIIEAIADGSQDIDGIDGLMTSGARRFRYRLQNAHDMDDAWGLNGDLTARVGTVHVPAINPAIGRILHSVGPIRPVALAPTRTLHATAQATFTTPGDLTTGTATVRTPGGTYSGITPAAIEARLIRQDGVQHVGWSTVDAAPSAGAWAVGSIPDVPGVAGLLALEMRAVDGSGNALASCFSHGLVGVGTAKLSSGQSQLMYGYFNGGGVELEDNTWLIATTITNGSYGQYIITSGNPTARGAKRAIRQMAREVNEKLPGWPIHAATVGQSGAAVEAFAPGGENFPRWENAGNLLAPVQPHYLYLFGHSSGAGGGYRAYFEDMLAEAIARLGAPLKVLAVPVSRYSGASTGSNYTQVSASRNAMHGWYLDNLATAVWGGSMNPIETSETGSDPHPSDADKGQGRMGVGHATNLLSAAGFLPARPPRIVAASNSGGRTVLEFGT